MVNFDRIDVRKAALVMMHFQADVFSMLPSEVVPDLLDRANRLIEAWRGTERPIVFANVALGADYELANAANMLITNSVRSGLFREPTPAAGLEMRSSDLFYSCPRASIFFGTTLDSDLRDQGVDTLVTAGIASSGVLFSSIGWASDADYHLYIVRDCCYDPDVEAHEALFRTSFATRAVII